MFGAQLHTALLEEVGFRLELQGWGAFLYPPASLGQGFFPLSLTLALPSKLGSPFSLPPTPGPRSPLTSVPWVDLNTLPHLDNVRRCFRGCREKC